MSSPHPLNQAVIAHALHLLRNGQLRYVLAWGFTERDLEALLQPAMASALANARVPWCNVKVNRDVLQRLLKQACDYDKELEATYRMLRLGASTEMVSEFYGLTHQEVALRRQIRNLPQRKGRWPVLTEEQDAALWRRWSSCVKERGIDIENDTAMLALAMDLAEGMSLPLCVVWSAIRHWIEQGLL